MARQRTRSFDADIGEIMDVVRNDRAPDQLNFDELLPGEVHGHRKIQPTTYGYIAYCQCGWQSREVTAKQTARRRLMQHLGRTPQGNVLLRTLAKRGRGGSGA